jgi:hypothetical protein
MFCPNCGNALSDQQLFCSNCGSKVPASELREERHFVPGPNAPPAQQRPVAQVNFDDVKSKVKQMYQSVTGDDFQQGAASEENAQRYPHPYHKLGGWLGFVAYAQLVSIGLLAIAFLITFFSMMQFARYLDGLMIFVLLIELGGFILISAICVKFFIMIRSKNPRFLRFYELLMIVLGSIGVVVAVLSGATGFGVAEPIRSILSGVIGFFVWTAYFRKSVRVRTYFGSDEYLRQSIFFKNVIAPKPADTQRYTG